MKFSNGQYVALLCCATLILVVEWVSGQWTPSISVPAFGTPTAAVYDATYASTSLLGEYRENSSQYTFTNPLLFTETDQKQFTEYDAFDRQISSYIKSQQSAHPIEAISVYIRDMNSGHWSSVNERIAFEPSSLLKVAVVISYYRLAQKISDTSTSSVDSFMAQKIYYAGPDDTGQNYPPDKHLAPGYYSYKDLIVQMITYSDNSVMNLLLNNNLDEFNKVYSDFRLPTPVDNGAADYMTARSYSVVFRTLYNSTYLPWDISEKIMGLLASTTFTKGLVAGVPAGIIVAHKFGEHTNVLSNGTVVNHELHDCGIVYYDSHPYFLCVMTKGQDFAVLENIIATISRMSYAYVSSPYFQITVQKY